MSGVNKVILIGRLGAKPEYKDMDTKQVCNFSIATSENYVDKSGAKVEKTEWHNIVAWGKLASLCNKYLDKGREVYIEGRLQTDKYVKDDETRYTTKIMASTVQFIGGGGNKTDTTSEDNLW